MSNHSDDIVIRLREPNFNSDLDLFCIMEDAADEIERLRKLTSELASMMMPFALLMTSEEQEKVIKAVRGE